MALLTDPWLVRPGRTGGGLRGRACRVEGIGGAESECDAGDESDLGVDRFRSVRPEARQEWNNSGAHIDELSELPNARQAARIRRSRDVDLYGSNRDGGERLRTQMKRYAPARGCPRNRVADRLRLESASIRRCSLVVQHALLSSTAGGLRAGRPADAPAAKRATLRTCNWSCVGGQEFVLVGLSADLRTKGTHFPRD